jgi:fatty-acyl-CoA synthase
MIDLKPQATGSKLNHLTIGGLFLRQSRITPAKAALVAGDRTVSFRELNQLANRTAHLILQKGIRRGDAIAVLSENRIEFVFIQLACAKLGVAVACLNWRQAEEELAHCAGLVQPRWLFVSPLHAGAALAASFSSQGRLTLMGPEFERHVALQPDAEPAQQMAQVDPEDIWVVLYTSGTTGWPKGAAISQRALVARSCIAYLDGVIFSERESIAWAPMFHMASTDHIMMTLLHGGSVIMMDRFDPEHLAWLVSHRPIGNLPVMPSTADTVLAALLKLGDKLQPVGIVGSMADLVPPDLIFELTTLLKAPYRNTFGSTETGLAPASRGLIPIGVRPTRFSKTQSSLCDVKLIDTDGNELPDGVAGEVAVRGPSLFSGYVGVDTAQTFVDGWYPMGDVMVRNEDGTFDFVDRRKYLIKSGGENIYPAEIERVLLSSAGVLDAAVVRRPDTKWGEVPVAFVVRRDAQLQAAELVQLCRDRIAHYKCPKDIVFIESSEMPRTPLGKIQRHVLEERALAARPAVAVGS